MAKILTIFFVFATIISIGHSQCTLERAILNFRRSVYEFNARLVFRINQDTEGHFIASGLSPWSLISALSFGADGNTLSEIERVLRLHSHKCFNERYFEVAQIATTSTDSTILERSATIFVDESLELLDEFANNVVRTGLCNTTELSFKDTVSSASAINEYVSKSTHETIDEIVTPSDLYDVSMVMIDALYFKGTWKNQFPYEDTETSAFYNERGNQIGDVNLMFTNGNFNVTSMKTIKARVLEVPYGERDKYSMLIFLPFADVTVTQVLENLKSSSLNAIFNAFGRNGASSVAVQIPRFKITSDVSNLKDLLIDMGLRSMFDSTTANFPFLTFSPLYVSNFIQKAYIEVTEEGTTAAAVSEASFLARMLPEQFIANKPFIFMIVDRNVPIPLFTGAYSKPNIY
ncbi:hypothetical protein K1T71_012721 [Dendrolimus kikuchii]|uniref:Uncharacterized protein n=1 Tax=Dendrolimus kikuchii TaxID=765133 RepID=A0ACC1CK91_9NEOP|nr:hypothetical protein K1T71_012721 [Dendrolimus kikuchii]